MNLIVREDVELLRSISDGAGASSATLFLFDREAPVERTRFLFNLGPTNEINHAYRDSICALDPFLLLAADRLAQAPADLHVFDQAEVESWDQSRRTRPYWEFMRRQGYCESAASVHEVGDGLWLVLGLMRQGRERAHLSAQPVRDSTRRLFRRTASAIVRSAFPPQTSVRPDVALTGREQDVVDALCCGRSNKQIAAQLRLSEFTVENHLRRIYRKHAVRNRTSLMAVLGSRSPQAAPS
ncbi:helix-turn-helix transcriptional regulator [Hydrocarboniphaga effusa]|jgi:DNA-binding CsgD family transcriptional regulator|uniref:HTH luxR-type domain-containing protein n=1 Tax=Hydrocarboniphaga effusa AP103 TaxID=1172194 RepID=I8TAF9_9GAMM|nr:LuxR C-terminal-related transcriptional regulator [Hydrocarboniphaga effusa]EIT70695.1 hypothetical protein WQQ_08320 [Hydrocarboniphaga effusa AP103]